jgi:hypothetical protein
MTTFAVLRTHTSGCNSTCDPVTSTVVVELTPTVIAALLAAMDEVQAYSEHAGRRVTMSWMDYQPEVYEILPPEVEDDTPVPSRYDDFWDSGRALLSAHPFAGDEDFLCRLDHCELVVNDDNVCWYFRPDHSEQEEYTSALYRSELEQATHVKEEVAPCL